MLPLGLPLLQTAAFFQAALFHLNFNPIYGLSFPLACPGLSNYSSSGLHVTRPCHKKPLLGYVCWSRMFAPAVLMKGAYSMCVFMWVWLFRIITSLSVVKTNKQRFCIYMCTVVIWDRQKGEKLVCQVCLQLFMSARSDSSFLTDTENTNVALNMHAWQYLDTCMCCQMDVWHGITSYHPVLRRATPLPAPWLAVASSGM